jgi:hypothetical protein
MASTRTGVRKQEKKGKKTIHTHAVRLAIPGKKVHWTKKGKCAF